MPEYDHWATKALCAEVDPDLFFPEVGNSSHWAKEICKTCEVTEKCLTLALSDPTLTGIWGGTTFRERASMRYKKRSNV